MSSGITENRGVAIFPRNTGGAASALSNLNKLKDELNKAQEQSATKQRYTSIGQMSTEEIARVCYSDDTVRQSGKCRVEAENFSNKVSSAMKGVAGIATMTDNLIKTVTAANVLDPNSRNLINTEINNILQSIDLQLATPYKNGYLLGANIDKQQKPILGIPTESQNISLGNGVTVNYNIDPNIPFENLVKTLNDIKTAVNDVSVTAISPDKIQAFNRAHNNLTSFIATTLSPLKSTANEAVKSNNNAEKEAIEDILQTMGVNELEVANTISNLLQEIKATQNQIHVMQAAPNLSLHQIT